MQWLFQLFGWCLRNFSPAVFYRQTQLVLPTNDFFPGKVDSVQGMAELVFNRVAEYSGMSHWPWEVAEQSRCHLENRLTLPEGAGQAFSGDRQLLTLNGQDLLMLYDHRHIGNPEALIAGFAHRLGQYLGHTANEPIPGGEENWSQATEVIAVYLGFGLMFANSAFVFPPGGCSSCGTAVSRDNALSQWDCTYALAIFAVLKDIPLGQVRPHLKKSLRGYFQRCIADVRSREKTLQDIRDAAGIGQEQPVAGRVQ